jgi:hypothetical protein
MKQHTHISVEKQHFGRSGAESCGDKDIHCDRSYIQMRKRIEIDIVQTNKQTRNTHIRQGQTPSSQLSRRHA